MSSLSALVRMLQTPCHHPSWCCGISSDVPDPFSLQAPCLGLDPGTVAVLTSSVATLSIATVSTCLCLPKASGRVEFFYFCCFLSKHRLVPMFLSVPVLRELLQLGLHRDDGVSLPSDEGAPVKLLLLSPQTGNPQGCDLGFLENRVGPHPLDMTS